MTTELMVPQVENNAIANYDETTFNKLTEGGVSFLPRIQLYQSMSKEVQAKTVVDGHKLDSGEFGFIKGKDIKTIYGSVISFVPLAWRYKAIDFNETPPVSFYNPTSEQFKDIQARADGANSQCNAGIEFLVWVPDEQDFASLFCGSKTTRPEAPKIKAMIGKHISLKSKFIEGKKYSWYGFEVLGNSNPISNSFEPDYCKLTMETFLNPKDSEVEVDVADTASDRAR